MGLSYTTLWNNGFHLCDHTGLLINVKTHTHVHGVKVHTFTDTFILSLMGTFLITGSMRNNWKEKNNQQV